MSDVYKINVSMLKSYESAFKTELNNFNNSTYNTFSSSYLKSCGDNYVRRMTNELQIAYNKLKKSYNNIDKWWTEYNKNIEGLENYLSDSGTAGVISESSVRSSASNLPELQKYNISLAGTFAINPINTTYTTSFLNNSAVSTDLFSTLYTDYEVDEINQIENVEDVGGTISESSTSVLSGVGTWIKTATSNVWNVIKSVGAKVGTIFLSVVVGLLQFVGAVIDTLLLAGAVVFSIPLGIVDGVQAIFGATTGYEWESMTMWMWNDVKAEVSKKVVSPAFDKIYESDIGNWLQENTNNFPLFQLFDSIGIMDSENSFDLTRSIVSGIGYVAGIVLLTIATAGLGGAAVGSASAATATAATTASATTSIVTTVSNLSTQMAVTAGVAGVGKYTQEAWNDGASTFEGLAAGGIGGLWEALQFYVGGKISGLKIFGAKGVVGSVAVSEGKAKVLNGLARVILDAGDGGLEGFAAPFIQSIYKEGYYDDDGNYVEFLEGQDFAEKYKELFEDNGGWASVATNAEVGGFASLFGEVFDISKHIKKVKNADNPSYVIKHLKEFTDEEIKIDDILSTRTEEVKTALSSLNDKELTHLLQRIRDVNNLKFVLENTNNSNLLKEFERLGIVSAQKSMDDMDLGEIEKLDDEELYKLLMDMKDSETDLDAYDFVSSDNDDPQRKLDKLINENFANKDEFGFFERVDIEDILSTKTEKVKTFIKSLNNEELATLFESVFDSDNVRFILENTETPKLVNAMEYLDEFNVGDIVIILDSPRIVDLITQMEDSNEIKKVVNTLREWQLEALLLQDDMDSATYRKIVNNTDWYENRYLVNKIKGLRDYIEVSGKDKIRSISSDTLFQIITDDYDYERFINDFPNSSVKYYDVTKIEAAQGIKKFLDILEDNGYTLNFSKEQQARIDYIIENYYTRINNFNTWGEIEMLDRFRKHFSNYVPDEKIANVKGTFNYLTEEEFTALGVNPKAMAFNDGETSTMNTNYEDNIIRSNMSHESIHQISAAPKYIEPGTGNLISCRGLKLGILDITSKKWSYKYEGINEAVTEYLSELVMGADYPSGVCGYEPAVIRLKQIKDMNIEGFGLEDIKKAYFENDTASLANTINKVAGPNFFEDKLAPAFDIAIGDNRDCTELDKLVRELMLATN